MWNSKKLSTLFMQYLKKFILIHRLIHILWTNLSDFISISRGIVDITVDYISPLQI